MLSFGVFLAFLVVFFFLGRAFPVFCALPLFFLPLFSSGGVKICDFLGCLSSLFCGQRLLFMDKRCFFLIFYGKRRKRAKKQAKFRRLHALFCVFFVFSRLFGLFSWCFWLVFFDFREKQVLSGVFLRLFLCFLAKASPFYLFFLFFGF